VVRTEGATAWAIRKNSPKLKATLDAFIVKHGIGKPTGNTLCAAIYRTPNGHFSGAPAPSGLSGDEKVAYERLQFVYQKGIAYGFQMGLRPQTLYGIADLPVGLAAYFLDHDARSYELISRIFKGESEGLTR
jgi:hypothetical protein